MWGRTQCHPSSEPTERQWEANMKTRVNKRKNAREELTSKIVLREGCWVSVAENRGKVEVVFSKDGQRIRLLGDNDGIHIGTIVKEQ